MTTEQFNAKLFGVLSEDNELYTPEFLDEVNIYSDCMVEKNDYVNEFFLYFVIPKLQLIRQSGMQPPTGAGDLSYYWVFFKSSLHSVYLVFISLFFAVAIPVHVLFNYRPSKTVLGQSQSLAVVRSPAAFSKMIFLKREGIVFFADSLVYNSAEIGANLYSQNLFTRLIGLIITPWMALKDLFYLFKMTCSHLGFLSFARVLVYYRKRIPHKVLFEFYLGILLKNSNPNVLYTGNKEDRYSLVEKKLCKKQNIQLVCIPHGLEYAYKMPSGLAGDVFYCNSEITRSYFDSLYHREKNSFLFDRTVVSNMFSRNLVVGGAKEIIFFPESREPEKNLVIIQYLKNHCIDFRVKLHVKDNLDNYKPVINETSLIDDFDQAISNNICIARKSTVLLEAIYNQSIPIAVLSDSKDKAYFDFMFPSLHDEKIERVYSLDDLNSLIRRLMYQNV